MPDPLPFEYRTRQKDIKWEDFAQARRAMEQRDRELEDYLAAAARGGGGFRYAFYHHGVKWTAGIGWEIRFDGGTPGTMLEELGGIDFFTKTAGGSSPNKFVNVQVPETGIWDLGVEFRVILDNPASVDHQVRVEIQTDQSSFYSWDNSAAHDVTVVVGQDAARGAIHFMHPMELGSAIDLATPLLDNGVAGPEAIDVVYATIHIAYYSPATPPVLGA